MKSPSRKRAEFLLGPDVSEFVKWRLAVGTFVSPNLDYLYVDTGKCACTATKMHLWLHEGHPVREPWPQSVHERDPSDGRLSLLDLSYDQALHVLCDPNVVRFYVYRPAHERIVSAYLNKIQNLELENYDNDRYAIRQKFGLANNSEITLDHFAEFCCILPDAQKDGHWMSQSRVILANWIYYNEIVDIREYSRDMTRIFIKINAGKLPDFSEIINRTGSEEYAISDHILSKIRNAYAADYKLCVLPARGSFRSE